MLVDYRGEPVDYSISFDEFHRIWWEAKFFSCFNYKSCGFEYEEYEDKDDKFKVTYIANVGFKTFKDCLYLLKI